MAASRCETWALGARRELRKLSFPTLLAQNSPLDSAVWMLVSLTLFRCQRGASNEPDLYSEVWVVAPDVPRRAATLLFSQSYDGRHPRRAERRDHHREKRARQ